MYSSKNTLMSKSPKKILYRKKAEHIPPGYSWVTCCSFETSENEWHHYRGEDCMEKFCKDLKKSRNKNN